MTRSNLPAPVLDTDAWIWWVTGAQHFSRTLVHTLDTMPDDNRPAIAAISLWEVSMLVERGRLQLDRPLREWLQLAAHLRSVQLIPIDAEIASKVADLPEDFDCDPADRLITATCLVRKMPILTRDEAIMQSGLLESWPGIAVKESKS